MSHYSEVIGWVLLHFTWQASAIAIIFRGVDLKMRDRGATVRYTVALGALLCMLAASLATLVYEQMSLPRLPLIDISRSLGSLDISVVRQSQLDLFHSFVNDHSRGIFRWIDLLWLVGVLTSIARAVGGAWWLGRLQSTLSFEAVGEIAQRFTVMIERMGLRSPVSLRIHTAVSSPFVTGAFHAVVYLPISALTSLTADQIDAILVHELAHVRRADYAWNLMQTAMETLFFFHPAVWWVGRMIREQRELCCDDIVLEASYPPLTYAKALLALAEGRGAQPAFAMALDGNGDQNQLLSRVARILGGVCTPQRDSYRNVISRLFVPAVAGAIIFCGSVATSPKSYAFVTPAKLINLATSRMSGLYPQMRVQSATPQNLQHPTAPSSQDPKKHPEQIDSKGSAGPDSSKSEAHSNHPHAHSHSHTERIAQEHHHESHAHHHNHSSST